MGFDWEEYFGTYGTDDLNDFLYEWNNRHAPQTVYKMTPEEKEDYIMEEKQKLYEAQHELDYIRYEDGWIRVYFNEEYNTWCLVPEDFYMPDPEDCYINTPFDDYPFYYILGRPQKKIRGPKRSKRVLKAQKRRWLKKYKLEMKKLLAVHGEVIDKEIPF